MTMFLVQLVATWLILLFLYIFTLAIGARAFGVEILEVSFGSGKVLWSHGYVKLRAMLLTGYVKLKDTRELSEPRSNDPNAHSRQSDGISGMAHDPDEHHDLSLGRRVLLVGLRDRLLRYWSRGSLIPQPAGLNTRCVDACLSDARHHFEAHAQPA